MEIADGITLTCDVPARLVKLQMVDEEYNHRTVKYLDKDEALALYKALFKALNDMNRRTDGK